MTSILHNSAASAALQTLRAVNSNLSDTQSQVSSGLKVSKASDNVAYWSISTTMKSDSKAISAADDAMNVGASKVATAYAGLESTLDILGEFKSKLVTAKESSVDKAKVQQELDQLKQQARAIATSASFNGENWLSTDVDDIYDGRQNEASVVSSFTRDQSGGVAVHSLNVDLLGLSLFNTTGGGLLQADPRDLDTMGGLRFDRLDGARSTYTAGSNTGTGPAAFQFAFQFPDDEPLTFTDDSELAFDITIDADNPADPISAPYSDGQTTSIVIDKNMVDTVLGRDDGVISSAAQYASVLNYALQGSGAVATYSSSSAVYITHTGIASLDGSSMEISGVTATDLTINDAMADRAVSYGSRQSSLTLDYKHFTVMDDVVASMDFTVDHEATHLSFTREDVNRILNVDNGTVSTSDEMATLLTTLLDRSDITIAANGDDAVEITTDPTVHRKSGEKSGIGFYNVGVNIEPVPTLDFMSVDIVSNPGKIDSYLNYIQVVSDRVTDAAATLGTVQNRMDMQSNFAKSLMTSMDQGVSTLVDADMEESSARLSALQTQQQLAVQSLQIANSAPQGLLSLFN
ncbi:MAG: flagellin [Neorhizobium sp.]|nr:flagellin [Neorhizobium sp.]